MQKTTARVAMLNNLVWLFGSLGLAFLVWLSAVVQADPVEQVLIDQRVPIAITPDAALILSNANELPVNASVSVRGPRSVINAMTAEDVSIAVDLTGYSPGTYTLALEAIVAPDKRASVVRITPRNYTVRLETRLTQLKPVSVQITSFPGAAYEVGTPQTTVLQTEVSGPESRVSRVDAVVARVSLAEQRAPFSQEVALVPVDAEGVVVPGVTLGHAAVEVEIAVQQRNDVAEVRVQPNIVGELPLGYILTPDFNYTPQTVILRGGRAVLDALPGTIFTEAIDLSGRTSSFQVDVPIALPDPRLLVVTGSSISVRVGIAAQQVTRQFDQVALTLIGEMPGVAYTVVPDVVTVLVTGPQPLLANLDSADLGVLVDVSGLAPGGSAQIAPLASVGQDNPAVSASLLPAQVDVTARPLAATPTAGS